MRNMDKLRTGSSISLYFFLIQVYNAIYENLLIFFCGLVFVAAIAYRFWVPFAIVRKYWISAHILGGVNA
jgi:hypothetical protein